MIEINNLTTISIDEEFLKKVAQKVLKGENKEEVELSIALVGQGRIRELNKKYRRKNRVTDILAFSENTKYKIPRSTPHQILMGGLRGRQNTGYKIRDLGEIVICLREVKKNAKRFNSVFERELARVLIHGILHLLGEDHETSKLKAKKMEEKQENYLKLFFRQWPKAIS